jgi:hypothetical protein
MGYEPGAQEDADEDRRHVLEEVAAGRMSAQEAVQHLKNRQGG